MNSKTLPHLQVSENRRHLVTETGAPFFWLGDTAWELFHRLNVEEVAEYLDCRAEQGFTVIQAVALAEFEGITVPNAYGHLPLRQNAEGAYEPALPDTDPAVDKQAEPGSDGYSYWSHVCTADGWEGDTPQFRTSSGFWAATGP